MSARPAVAGDAEAIARIYDEGIEDRLATFETEPRDAGFPLVVLEDEGEVIERLIGEAADV